LSLESPFQLNLMLVGKARAYPRGEHLKGASLRLATGLNHEHYTLGWKGLPGPNTLDYYEHSQITDIKSLKTLATELTDENMGIEIIKPGKKTIFHCNQGKALFTMERHIFT
jgi:hypothetical protein